MMRFLRGRRPIRPKWGLIGWDERPSFGAVRAMRDASKRRALASAANVLVRAERLVGLHPDRDLWTRAGWEAFIQALLRVLAEAAENNQQVRTDLKACLAASDSTSTGSFSGLGSAHRMKVGKSIVVETFAGTRSVVVPLDGGVYLVGEARADDPALGASEAAIVGALENGATDALRGGSKRHWTTHLRSRY